MMTDIEAKDSLHKGDTDFHGGTVCDLPKEPEDLSKRPDDYMGHGGEGYLYRLPLGLLRLLARESIEAHSPGYIWSEVPAKDRFTLSWIGMEDESTVERSANLEVGQRLVALELADMKGTWKAVDRIVDKSAEIDESCRCWVDIYGIGTFPCPNALPVGKIDPTFLASHLILMEFAG